MSLRYARAIKLAAVLALLLVSLPSLKLIPFHRFWGLDLHYHQAFHTCEAKNNPYLMTGQQCHDDGWRDMYSPPLRYFAFTWTRWCSLAVAIRIWATVIGLGTLVCLVVWTRRKQWREVGRIELGAFILLLIAQFPTVFAMERGNCDVLVLILWTIAMALYRSGRVAASGYLAGTAAATKLYPIFGCFVVGAGLIWRAVADKGARRLLAKFAIAGVASVIVACLAFLPQTIVYVTKVLPRFAAEMTPLFVYSHSLQHLSPENKAVGAVLFALLLLPWVIASARLIQKDPVLILAGGLALSTYWASTSYDYNLLTVYPLLLVLFVRAFDRRAGLAPVPTALLMLGLFAVIGPRSLFVASDEMKKLHILIEWAWLLSTGACAGWLVEQAPAPAPAASRDPVPAN